MDTVVILRQRNRDVCTSACLHCLLIGLQHLHQCVHKLDAKIELPRALLPDRPELEGIEDAHIEQPPCQARPALLALPSYQVASVELIDAIYFTAMEVVVSDGARAWM